MNVSIIGSCHTRDIFNSKFISNYKEYFKLCSYFPRTSMLSVVGKPVAYNYPRLMESSLSELQKEKWYYEFEKPVLKTLAAQRPDILLLDFYGDARYGACMYDGEYLANQVKQLKGKKVIKENTITIEYSYRKNTEEFFTMWRNAADRFAAYIKRWLPGTLVIINTVKGTNLVEDKNGKRYKNPKIPDQDVRRINALWKRMDRYMAENHNVRTITYDREYMLDAEYPFGLGVQLVHFQQEYYQDYFQKLVEMAGSQEYPTHDRKRHPKFNLLNRRMFEFGREKCYQMTGKFEKLEYPDYIALKPVDCREELGEYRPQIWSKAVEINGDGKTWFKLSFFIKADSLEEINEETTVFAVRTFKGVKSKNLSESISAYSLNLQGHKLKEGKAYRYEFKFCPKGKYIKIAPFLFEYIDGIEYSRFRLEYTEQPERRKKL